MTKQMNNTITNVAVTIATILAVLSGYYVMQIVYDSIAASIIFGLVWGTIVFSESRFSYISLNVDGRIAITKEEVKNNLGHIIVAILLAFWVSVPLELWIYRSEIISFAGEATNDLNIQMQGLIELFASNWVSMLLIFIIIAVVYQIPIFMKMASEE